MKRPLNILDVPMPGGLLVSPTTGRVTRYGHIGDDCPGIAPAPERAAIGVAIVCDSRAMLDESEAT